MATGTMTYSSVSHSTMTVELTPGHCVFFLGSALGIDDDPVTTIHGEAEGENLGLYTYRFGAGDLNGDGRDDLVVRPMIRPERMPEKS